MWKDGYSNKHYEQGQNVYKSIKNDKIKSDKQQFIHIKDKIINNSIYIRK